ncbi:MAG: Panacea domain-containing protein [Salinispira sp.]
MNRYNNTAFDEKKATALAATIIKNDNGKGAMNYMKLLKMMYMCDRLTLRKFNHTITHDTYIAMKKGPVLSYTYNIIAMANNTVPGFGAFWKKYIHTDEDRYEVTLCDSDGPESVLSSEENDIARYVSDSYKLLNEWEIVDIIYMLCDEWKDSPKKNAGNRPISLDMIRKAIREEEREDKKTLAQIINNSQKREKILSSLIHGARQLCRCR